MIKERKNVPLSSAISVDAFFSLFHLNLENLHARGELHDFYELVYVERGFYYSILDGEYHVVPPGSLIFFAPNVFHTDDGQTKSTAVVDILSFATASPLMHFFDNRCIALTTSQKDAFFATFHLAQRLLTQTAAGELLVKNGVRAHELQVLKNQFELFLLALYDSLAASDTSLNHMPNNQTQFRIVADYLKQNLARSLTLETIAAECAMSVSGLKALFRTFCGCGPIAYLNSLRIIAAKVMIRDGVLNFSEIAEKTGFSSIHYFSRSFKAKTGMTPSEYAQKP